MIFRSCFIWQSAALGSTQPTDCTQTSLDTTSLINASGLDIAALVGRRRRKKRSLVNENPVIQGDGEIIPFQISKVSEEILDEENTVSSNTDADVTKVKNNYTLKIAIKCYIVY